MGSRREWGGAYRGDPACRMRLQEATIALFPWEGREWSVCFEDAMSDDQLEKLKMVLEIAERNGNQLFAENILKEIKAIESGEISPIVKDYAADQMDQQE